MLAAFFIDEFFNLSVPKLRAIVTSYVLDLELELILNSSYELLNHSLCFTFILQKEYPSETTKVINNY
jgi:hypothetical protein